MQEEIKIGDVNVPVVRNSDEVYYPINFVMKNILLKKTGASGLQKEYSLYIKKFKIDYGTGAGGIQNVNCISEDGLKEILKHSKVGRLSVDQRKAMNILLEYLHMDVISEDDRFIKHINRDMIERYNEYIKDCIDHVLEINPDIVWQKCTKCGNYYPYHINFFKENPHSGTEYQLYTVCRDCNGWNKERSKDSIIYSDSKLHNIYKLYGFEIFKSYKQHDTIAIYNHWKSISKSGLPYLLKNKDDKLKIIKYMYGKGEFEKFKDLNEGSIICVCGFNLNQIELSEVYKYVLNVDIKENSKSIDKIENAKEIFFNYCNKNNIDITNPFGIRYYVLIRKIKLAGFIKRNYKNDLLTFVMNLYDNKYPAYMFGGGYQKYWKSQDNRDKALKYFIEQDMKISIEKIPLYITLTSLRNNGTNTMYSVCKKYYKNLYEWVNEVYPDVFDPRDFDIHYIRNDFDSIDEAEIHDVLNDMFKNVIYNPRNTDRTIVIDGMIPDWFIFTDIRCYIIEYFGMDVGMDTDNKRISEYQEKTKHKIEKYNNDIKNYGKLYIFPDDLKDNFSGLKEKLKMII